MVGKWYGNIELKFAFPKKLKFAKFFAAEHTKCSLLVSTPVKDTQIFFEIQPHIFLPWDIFLYCWTFTKKLISKGLSQVTLTSLNLYLLPLVSVKVVPPMESHPTVRKEKKANKNVFFVLHFQRYWLEEIVTQLFQELKTSILQKVQIIFFLLTKLSTQYGSGMEVMSFTNKN